MARPRATACLLAVLGAVRARAQTQASTTTPGSAHLVHPGAGDWLDHGRTCDNQRFSLVFDLRTWQRLWQQAHKPASASWLRRPTRRECSSRPAARAASTGRPRRSRRAPTRTSVRRSTARTTGARRSRFPPVGRSVRDSRTPTRSRTRCSSPAWWRRFPRCRACPRFRGRRARAWRAALPRATSRTSSPSRRWTGRSVCSTTWPPRT